MRKPYTHDPANKATSHNYKSSSGYITSPFTASISLKLPLFCPYALLPSLCLSKSPTPSVPGSISQSSYRKKKMCKNRFACSLNAPAILPTKTILPALVKACGRLNVCVIVVYLSILLAKFGCLAFDALFLAQCSRPISVPMVCAFVKAVFVNEQPRGSLTVGIECRSAHWQVRQESWLEPSSEKSE